jgi:hypothetical protein
MAQQHHPQARQTTQDQTTQDQTTQDQTTQDQTTQQTTQDPSTAVPQQRESPARAQQQAEPRLTGWLGWVLFAGFTMVVVGCFQAVMGLVGIFNTDFYVVTADNLAIPVNYTTWGVAHLILGLIVALAGLAVMAGKAWGRAVGIFLAAIQAIVNFAWFPAYPFWSLIVIAVDILVIYALLVHGGEMRALTREGTRGTAR